MNPPPFVDEGNTPLSSSAARRMARSSIPALLGALLVIPAIAPSAAHPAQSGVRADPPGAPLPLPDTARQRQLRYLLVQDCGSCHGMRLTGGLGPALTPQALAGKPALMLREVILYGRPGTPMPPWKTFLTEREAEWLVQILANGLGP